MLRLYKETNLLIYPQVDNEIIKQLALNYKNY